MTNLILSPILSQKIIRNVNELRKMAILSHFMNSFTYIKVNNYVVDFIRTYVILSRKYRGGSMFLKKGQKEGYIPYVCELIQVEL